MMTMQAVPLGQTGRFGGGDTVGSDTFVASQGGVSDLAFREFTLVQLRAAVMRNRLLIGAAIGAGMLAGFLIAFLSTPIYQATALLQIDQQAPEVFGDNTEDLTGQQTESDTYLPTQVEVLLSRSLADQVASSLGFYDKPALFAATGFDPPAAAPGSEAWKRAVISQLQGGLSATVRPGTRLIAVSFDSPSPDNAQAVANIFAERFISSTLERRFEASAYSRNFLAGQITQTREQLEDSERQLIDYARAAGITDVGDPSSAAGSGGGNSTLVAANLAKLNSEYATARTNRILAEQRWQQARNAPTLSLPEASSNSSIQALVLQRAQLKVEIEGERNRRGEAHPAVAELNRKITEIDTQIATLAARVRTSIREQYELALGQERGLEASVNALQGERVSEQGRGVQLAVLRRETDTNRALYDALLQRYRELNAAAGVTSNNISIVDRAVAPRTPISPQPVLNVLVGALLGLAVGFVLAFLRERFVDRVRSPEDVEEKLGLPVLGVMPKIRGEDPITHLDDPKSSMSEAASTLRSLLQMATPQGPPKTLLVTSSSQSEGKTTTSISIARAFSHAGYNVLLIDSDMRRPSLHLRLGTDNKVGLSNVLFGDVAPQAAVRQTEVEHLSVVTSGPIPPSAPQLLTRDAMGRALSDYAGKFDVVIIDSPPILGLADVIQLSALTDAVLFVLDAESKRIAQIRTSLRRLLRANARVIGVVLTKFDFNSHCYDTDGYYNYYRYDVAKGSPD